MYARAIAKILLMAGFGFALYGAGIFAMSEYGQREAAGNPKTNEMAVPETLQAAGLAGRLYFPRLNKVFAIYPDDGPNLLKGPVWLKVTARPGGLGNCIVAAHRDTHFRFLKEVRVGDIFEMTGPAGRFKYKVSGSQIVDPKNRYFLNPTKKSVLTLVTCYPFYYVGNAPKRFIIRADLMMDKQVQANSISPEKASTGETQ